MPQFLKDSDMPTPKLPTNPVGVSSAGASRGFRVNNDFSGTAIPMIDARGFVAADLAQGDIGAAVSGVSNGLAQAVQKRNEMLNQQKVLQAQLSMQQAETDIAAKIANEPDPTKWADIAKQGADAHAKMLLADKSLSPDAADAIQSQALRWQSHVTTTAQIQSVHRGRQLLGEQLHANAINAADQGDFSMAQGFIDHGAREGVFAPDRAAMMKMNLRQQEKQQVLNNATALVDDPARRDITGARKLIEESDVFHPDEKAVTLARLDASHAVGQQADELQALTLKDPTEALKALDDPQRFRLLPPGDREEAKLKARRVQASFATDTFTAAKEGIDLDQVKNVDDLNAPVFKQLTPHMKLELSGYLQAKNQKDAMNDPVTYQQAYSAVSSYDPAQDESGLKKAELAASIQSRFSGPYEKGLIAQLEANSKEDKLARIPLGDAYHVIDTWAFKDKRFGEYETQKLGPDGKPIVKEQDVKTMGEKGSGFLWFRKWMPGADPVGTPFVQDLGKKPVPVMEVDPVKRDEVTRKAQSIKQQLDEDVKSGKITTRDDVMKRLSELAKIPLAESASSEAVKASGVLPDIGSGSMSNALFPSRVDSIIKRYANP